VNASRASATKRAAAASVATACFLLGLKAYALAVTNSVAMLGSLADSGLDLIAALVTLWAVRIAALPADHDHRFGHGKAEALAALFQVGLIAASAAAIVWSAVDRLFAATPPTTPAQGIAVSLVAIAATYVLTAYQARVIRQTGSVAIRADRAHYQSDLLLNGAVIAALALEAYAGLTGVDPLFGLLIAFWLGWNAARASGEAVNQLMDREWPEERRRRFLAITMNHPANRGTHDLRTRTSGGQEFAQFHMWVDPALSVAQAHDVMDEIEAALEVEFPGVDVLIHVDPEGQVDKPGNPLAEMVEPVEVAALGKREMMSEYRLVQVDAFADRPFTGNPAAVMPLDAWLPDATLQAIAMENNLSETAFTVPLDGGEAGYELRWFTPTIEVALCGHATLASGHVLMEGGEVRFLTRKAGVLAVRRDGDGYALDLPVTLVREQAAPELLDVLGTPAASVHLSYSGAEATAIVLLDDAAAVRACAPDMKRLAGIELMVIVTALGRETDVVSRVFVPAWGVDEDPVTGSAHAALTPFWADRLGRPSFSAFQASRRGGRVECRLSGDRAILGGRCVTVIEGVMRL
jgi:ferrous-iron efflux pump FieF